MEPIPRVAKLLQQMQRHYRLRLCLMALCQAISLNNASAYVDPTSSPNRPLPEWADGGDAGNCPRVRHTSTIAFKQLIYYLYTSFVYLYTVNLIFFVCQPFYY